MRGAERVVDVDLGERREPAGELGIVGGLAGVEAEVLEQADAARLERLDRGASGLADAVVREGDRRPHQLGEPRRDRPQAVGRIRRALRPAAVRRERQAGAGAPQLAQRG